MFPSFVVVVHVVTGRKQSQLLVFGLGSGVWQNYPRFLIDTPIIPFLSSDDRIAANIAKVPN